MTLVITKKEIEYAIESFIKEKGYMKNDKKLKVNIICGRGEKGLRAEVEEVNEIKQLELLDTKKSTQKTEDKKVVATTEIEEKTTETEEEVEIFHTLPTNTEEDTNPFAN